MSRREHSTAALSVGLLAVIAVAARVAHLWSFKDSVYWSLLLGDAARYHAWGAEIAAGDWLGEGVFYQSPLYPYVLGLLYKLTGPSVMAARVLNLLLGVGATLLLYVAATRLCGQRVGWLTAMLFTLNPSVLFHEGLLQKSSLGLCLFCGLLATLAGLSRRPRRTRDDVWLGVLAGLFALVRENAFLLLPVLLAWMQFGSGFNLTRAQRAARGLSVVAGLLLVLLPVLARNHSFGGQWVLTTAQFGPNLWIGNGAQANGTYIPLVAEHGTPAHEQTDAKTIAEQAAGRAFRRARSRDGGRCELLPPSAQIGVTGCGCSHRS
ncbi:MAG: glycosyltransferase family 39 protein [Planctomycetaceae bacterium]